MKSNNTGRLIVRLFVFVISLVLVGADLVSSAQDANSGTTQQEDTSAQNTNTSGMNMNSGGRRRRGRRRSGGNMNANDASTVPADTTVQQNTNTADAPQENTNTSGEATGNTNMGGRRRRGRRRSAATTTPGTESQFVNKPIQVFGAGRCDPMAQEQTDLSGTYTGSIDYSEGGLSGDATLTISGNDFTLTGGGSTVEGRVVAVTTCNYTAATMRFGKDASLAPGPTPPPPLPIVSLRARRTGGGLVLETVPGESRQFSFRSAGAPGGGRRGMRGGRKRGGPPPVGIKPPTATGHDH